jgi:hypothetical protein
MYLVPTIHHKTPPHKDVDFTHTLGLHSSSLSHLLINGVEHLNSSYFFPSSSTQNQDENRLIIFL